MEGYTTPKKMKKLGDLFERYNKRFKAPQASVEKECITVIKEITSIEVTLKYITYTVSTRTIFIQAPSLLKSELRFHHSSILQALEKRLGKDVCPKVII
jgi:hypothetical protein